MTERWSDSVHRAVAGAPVTQTQLKWAGRIGLVWFLMDLAQWVDWLWSKF